ncbi:Hypothetical predicted protein [Scomber scombrus]|uniref:Uncharacterized protein n=1 Tax=Scomber scombrus TaxID=13677 RepID=A0AAV1MSY1_SCOSC
MPRQHNKSHPIRFIGQQEEEQLVSYLWCSYAAVLGPGLIYTGGAAMDPKPGDHTSKCTCYPFGNDSKEINSGTEENTGGKGFTSYCTPVNLTQAM